MGSQRGKPLKKFIVVVGQANKLLKSSNTGWFRPGFYRFCSRGIHRHYTTTYPVVQIYDLYPTKLTLFQLAASLELSGSLKKLPKISKVLFLSIRVNQNVIIIHCDKLINHVSKGKIHPPLEYSRCITDSKCITKYTYNPSLVSNTVFFVSPEVILT